MSKSLIIISDLHGAFYTFKRLLAKCPKNRQLIFGGDLIDRGPHSRKMVEYAMDNKIPTVAANHDDLCLAFYNHKGAKCANMYDRGVWLENGGDVAVPNWPLIDKRVLTGPQIAQAEFIGGRVPDKVLDWFAELPAYIIPDAEPDENGRRILVSHTGYGLEADDGDWFQALWGRHSCGDGDFPGDNYFRVHGHTLAKKVVITESMAMVDTGAAYKSRGYGIMTAFLWPEKTAIQQEYDESPL